MNDEIRRLQEKIAYLERHVIEQDKAMLELVEDIARLRRELATMRDRAGTGTPGAEDNLPDERPPHY